MPKRKSLTAMLAYVPPSPDSTDRNRAANNMKRDKKTLAGGGMTRRSEQFVQKHPKEWTGPRKVGPAWADSDRYWKGRRVDRA